jgi:hypothetical protein
MEFAAMSIPISLTDDQLEHVFRAARPLALRDREAFLQAVADGLRGKTIGDGEVYRAIRTAQRAFYEAPVLDETPRHRISPGRPGKYV